MKKYLLTIIKAIRVNLKLVRKGAFFDSGTYRIFFYY